MITTSRQKTKLRWPETNCALAHHHNKPPKDTTPGSGAAHHHNKLPKDKTPGSVAVHHHNKPPSDTALPSAVGPSTEVALPGATVVCLPRATVVGLIIKRAPVPRAKQKSCTLSSESLSPCRIWIHFPILIWISKLEPRAHMDAGAPSTVVIKDEDGEVRRNPFI